MKIRPLTPTEWQLKRDLRLAALKDSPQAFSSSYDLESDRSENAWRGWPDNGVFFAAFNDDDAAVGMVAGYLRLPAPGVARLIGMWVAPQARGLGVSVRLTSAVIEWAKERAAKRLELEIASGNDAARRSYLRSGFILTNRKPSTSCGAVLELLLSDS